MIDKIKLIINLMNLISYLCAASLHIIQATVYKGLGDRQWQTVIASEKEQGRKIYPTDSTAATRNATDGCPTHVNRILISDWSMFTNMFF